MQDVTLLENLKNYFLNASLKHLIITNFNIEDSHKKFPFTKFKDAFSKMQWVTWK